MVLLKYVNRIFLLIVAVIMVVSCEEKIFVGGVDCDECYSNKPTETTLEISLTTAGLDSSEVMVLLFNKYFHPHNILDTFYTKDNKLFVDVTIGRDYSVAAHYLKNSNTIIAIDATKPINKKVSSACGDECWITESIAIDVSLKY